MKSISFIHFNDDFGKKYSENSEMFSFDTNIDFLFVFTCLHIRYKCILYCLHIKFVICLCSICYFMTKLFYDLMTLKFLIW